MLNIPAEDVKGVTTLLGRLMLLHQRLYFRTAKNVRVYLSVPEMGSFFLPFVPLPPLFSLPLRFLWHHLPSPTLHPFLSEDIRQPSRWTPPRESAFCFSSGWGFLREYEDVLVHVSTSQIWIHLINLGDRVLDWGPHHKSWSNNGMKSFLSSLWVTLVQSQARHSSRLRVGG